MSAENDQAAAPVLRPQDEIARQSVVDHKDPDQVDEANACNDDFRDGGYATTQPTALLTKLLAAQADVRELPKDAENSYDGYRYTSADAIIAEGRRALNGAGLIVRRVRWEILKNDVVPGHLIVLSWFAVQDPDTGEDILDAIPYPFTPKRGAQWDKALSGALTTVFAYWLRDLLAIPRSDAEVDNQRVDEDKEKPPGTRRRRRTPATDGGAPPAGSTSGAVNRMAVEAAKDLDRAYDEMVICVKMHNPEESADDDELRKRAAEHFKTLGKKPTAALVREMTDQIAAKYADVGDADSPSDEDQDRTRVLDEIASNKWSSRVFDPLRASAEFAGGDPIRYLQVRGLDLSTKQGRSDLGKQLSKGIDWNAADLQVAK